jgi:hypothetical protein
MRKLSFPVRACVAVFIAVVAGSSAAWSAQNAAQAPASTREKTGEVLRQPLKDLNVVRDAIPETLQRVKADPYAKPKEATCHAVRVEIYELDYALGEDLDVRTAADESMSKKLSNETYNLARGAVSGLIPYRGILRRVTGAEKQARLINEALLAGAARRSYLKGFGESLGCAYPAAPKRAEPSTEPPS